MSDQSSASDEGKDKGVDENSEKNGGKGLNSQRTSGSSSSDGAGTKVVSKFLKTNSDEKISAASVKQSMFFELFIKSLMHDLKKVKNLSTTLQTSA